MLLENERIREGFPMMPSEDWQPGYGPMAMKKKRLAQVEAMIAQYSALIANAGGPETFGIALKRAVAQKRKIENWLAADTRPAAPAGSSGISQ